MTAIMDPRRWWRRRPCDEEDYNENQDDCATLARTHAHTGVLRACTIVATPSCVPTSKRALRPPTPLRTSVITSSPAREYAPSPAYYPSFSSIHLRPSLAATPFFTSPPFARLCNHYPIHSRTSTITAIASPCASRHGHLTSSISTNKFPCVVITSLQAGHRCQPRHAPSFSTHVRAQSHRQPFARCLRYSTRSPPLPARSACNTS
jgi:hypothetical protein